MKRFIAHLVLTTEGLSCYSHCVCVFWSKFVFLTACEHSLPTYIVKSLGLELCCIFDIMSAAFCLLYIVFTFTVVVCNSLGRLAVQSDVTGESSQ